MYNDNVEDMILSKYHNSSGHYKHQVQLFKLFIFNTAVLSDTTRMLVKSVQS